MPYIKRLERLKYDSVLSQLKSIDTKGELEYCIFLLMKLYMNDKKVSYTELHNTVYAAQHCGDEFRRRYLDKREDQVINENGDI